MQVGRVSQFLRRHMHVYLGSPGQGLDVFQCETSGDG
jgi:hypothetical protein